MRLTRLMMVVGLAATGLATSAPTASAVGIVGQVNFAILGSVAVTNGGTGLANITSATFPTTFVNGPDGDGSGVGDYQVAVAFTAVTFSPSSTYAISNVNGGPFAVVSPTVTFGPGGRFTFTPSFAQISSTGPDLNGASSLSYTSTGVVTDSMVGGYDPTVSSLSFSLTQTTLDARVNGSFTLISPAEPLIVVPEPASLALVGVAVAGVAARRVRRKA